MEANGNRLMSLFSKETMLGRSAVRGWGSCLAHHPRSDEGCRASANRMQSVMGTEVITSPRYHGREEVVIRWDLSFTPQPKWESSSWDCNNWTYHLHLPPKDKQGQSLE